MDLWLFYIPDFINYADYFLSFCCHRGIDTEQTKALEKLLGWNWVN